MQSPPSQQQFAPEPYQQQRAFFRAFAPSYPPQAQNQQMNGYFNTPQSVQMRSFINNAIYPSYPCSFFPLLNLLLVSFVILINLVYIPIIYVYIPIRLVMRMQYLKHIRLEIIFNGNNNTF